jgi:hypothetical protein
MEVRSQLHTQSALLQGQGPPGYSELLHFWTLSIVSILETRKNVSETGYVSVFT